MSTNNTEISDVTPLAAITGLRELYLKDSKATDSLTGLSFLC